MLYVDYMKFILTDLMLFVHTLIYAALKSETEARKCLFLNKYKTIDNMTVHHMVLLSSA